MENNKSNKETFEQGQQSTGSAENMGLGRYAQKNQTAHLSEEDRQEIANQLGPDKDRLADLNDLGALSGRDDYAGGDNDGMSDVSTDEPTDR